CGAVIPAAEKLLGARFPAWADDAYLEFSRSGRRPPGERMLAARSAWLRPLVLAECLEDQGRFLPALGMALTEYVDEPTWTLPAHDGKLENFHRTAYSVDLRSSAFAFELATAIAVLGDRLDPALRARVLAALDQRVFAPLRATLVSGKGHAWLGTKANPVQNNWNPVVLSGVVGAALAVLPARQDRAVFAAAGEHYPRYYLNSFRDDGYCDEGAGYWGYGFGDFVLLREELVHATGGRVEPFADPRIRAIALYGPRVQLLDRLAPPFSDCRAGVRVDAGLCDYCDAVLHLGMATTPDAGAMFRSRMATIGVVATPLTGSAGAAEAVGLRTWFDRAGVLVCRPAVGGHLAVAIKGGGNGSHSHNDIGSYILCLDDQLMAGDPGGPYAYDNKTFTKERYDHKLLNSYGHPVPVVAGQLQRVATQVTIPTPLPTFSDAADEVRIDLTKAYAAPALTSLVRTLRCERGGLGLVRISDAVVFASPQAFAVAIPTRATWKRIADTTLELSLGGHRVLATIACPVPFTINDESIQELDAPAFTRIAVTTTMPVQATTIAVTFTPQP
ncbi:MAG: heparinase II/III family protein, partial [Planctomycetes bacterium]|nr:heparinase II/III family protein [Planctomycetota bacterium]